MKLGRPHKMDPIFSKMGISKDAIDRFWDSYTPLDMNLPAYYKMNNGSTIHLYAYTDDKKYAKRFESDRDMRLFIKRSKKITNREYMQFESDTKYAKLSIYEIDGEHKVLLPQHEIDQIEDFKWRMDIELSELAVYPYQIFTDEYVKALDIILYCTYHQWFWGKDPDYYDYNYSGYGITAEGYGNGVYNHIDDLAVYCYIYSLVLRKDDLE